MKEKTMKWAAENMNGALHIFNNDETAFHSVAIDSRRAKEGGIFFCIIGAKNDAHRFIPDVRERGCRNIVISDQEWLSRIREMGEMNVILVKDTTRALMDMTAAYVDGLRGIKKVGITGSVGKTSTKEFTASVLESKYKVGKTEGNLNSEYGVPLTVFALPDDIEVAVIEMGVGGGTRMCDLAEMIKPDAAVVTTIGSSHLEAFGTRNNLRREKLSICDGFTKDNVLVINSDNDMLHLEDVAGNIEGSPHIITVGSEEGCDYRISEVCDGGINGVKCSLDIFNHNHDQCRHFHLALNCVGAHNLWNAAEAVAIGCSFGIDPADAVRAAENADIGINGNRLEIVRRADCTIINDAYNASPESMKSGIDVLMNTDANRHIAVLGDMFELGEQSEYMHADVGRYAAEHGVERLVTIGSNAGEIARGAMKSGMKDIGVFSEAESALESINSDIREGDVFLLKASRAMRFERLAEQIGSSGHIY